MLLRIITLAACLLTLCLALTIPYPLNDVFSNSNFTDNEICYIRLYGVTILDGESRKAYGLKQDYNTRSTGLLWQEGFEGLKGDRLTFRWVLANSDLHEYDDSRDYCEELTAAITRKAKWIKLQLESGRNSCVKRGVTKRGRTFDELVDCEETKCAHSNACLAKDEWCSNFLLAN